MKWRCASCGVEATTNRKKCSRCGSLIWKPAPKKDLSELSGPMKRIAPRGLVLAVSGKQAPIQDPNAIECGNCHVVIYRSDRGYDAKELEKARERHYATSPACKGQ